MYLFCLFVVYFLLNFLFLAYSKYTIAWVIGACKLIDVYTGVIDLQFQCYTFIFYWIYCVL